MLQVYLVYFLPQPYNWLFFQKSPNPFYQGMALEVKIWALSVDGAGQYMHTNLHANVCACRLCTVISV